MVKRLRNEHVMLALVTCDSNAVELTNLKMTAAKDPNKRIFDYVMFIIYSGAHALLTFIELLGVVFFRATSQGKMAVMLTCDDNFAKERMITLWGRKNEATLKNNFFVYFKWYYNHKLVLSYMQRKQ